MKFAILVVWSNGEEEYVKQGLSDTIALFTKREAEKQVEFMKIGMDGDPDMQTISVVKRK